MQMQNSDGIVILHLCVACVGAIACTTAAIMRPQENKACIFGMLVDEKYLWLCFALALWGLGQGAGPVVEALLADSTRTGDDVPLYSFYMAVRARFCEPLAFAALSALILMLSCMLLGSIKYWILPCQKKPAYSFHVMNQLLDVHAFCS